MKVCMVLQFDIDENDFERLAPQFNLMFAKVDNYWQHLVSVHLSEPAKDETAQ